MKPTPEQPLRRANEPPPGLEELIRRMFQDPKDPWTRIALQLARALLQAEETVMRGGGAGGSSLLPTPTLPSTPPSKTENSPQQLTECFPGCDI